MTQPYEIYKLRERIGTNLHQARMKKGMTLELLSRLTEIGARKLDRYEMGKQRVRLEVLLTIAAALEMDIETFFREQRTPV